MIYQVISPRVIPCEQPGPTWSPNQEKSRCIQRAWKRADLKGLFVCILATMRPSGEVGNLKGGKQTLTSIN